MSQKFSLYEALTVDQNIAFFGGIYGLSRRTLRRAPASSCSRWRASQGRENTLTRELPGGWRQRLALGCAILHEPRIVFLDEPTGGVDPLSRRRFWDLIGELSRQGVTVLVTTHYLDEAEHCHRIAIIQAGKLAALGTATELKQVFASRPILEIHASQPVQAMAILDKHANVEKTSLFGTAVHAVLRNASTDPAVLAAALRAEGIEVTSIGAVIAVTRRRLPRRRRTRRSGVMRKTLAVASKELRQILRDRRSLLILLFVPAFFLLLYGYALNFDIRNVQAGRAGPGSQHQEPRAGVVVRELRLLLAGRLRRFTSGARSPGRRRPGARDPDDPVRLRARPVAAAAGDGAGDHRRRQRQHRVDRDGLRADADRRIQRARRCGALARSARTANRVQGFPSITVEPRIWYNPQLRSTLFLVPGLIAYISMITAVVSTALSVVREKERGTMEQVRMAPLSPLPYIIGKTLPYLVISFVSAILVILSAMLLFDLPMRGSWLLLCAAIGLFLIGAQAQGLLISTIAETQQVAFQIALLSSLLPTMILSGFIFPISSMPTVVQWITHIVPARYFLVALRAIVLKGADITAFWQDMMALAIFATVASGLASLRLRREWA